MVKYPIYPIRKFLSPQTDKDLYVNTFRDHLKKHSFVEEPHRHNSYVLVFFTQGSGTHEIDFSTFTIQNGSVFFLKPGQIHHWSLSEDIDGFVIFYSEEMFNLYFRQKQIKDYAFYTSLNSRPELLFDATESKKLIPYFEAIVEEVKDDKEWRQDVILNVLDIIHIQIARKYNAIHIVETHLYNRKIKDLEALIERHFRTQKAPSFYASELHISLKHLNRICQEILQMTTTSVIVQRVILEAKRMLTDKRLTVNEIAVALGYDDYSYFSRLFKKQVGKSPTDFRLSRI
nr:AraC family transcriptional regulator [uncultured Flavobacterium sp.]